METQQACPECGTRGQAEKTCQDDFNQMLYWENENSHNWEVHHLMVLSYYIQHSNLYSLEGLKGAIHLLAEFLGTNITPQEVRQRDRSKVSSNTRSHKIKGTTASQGAYTRPVAWTQTAASVVANGIDNYCVSVRAWARSIYDALKASGNFPA